MIRRGPFAAWMGFLLVAALAFAVASRDLGQVPRQPATPTAAKAERPTDAAAEAVRSNNLGVAYMNQQRFAQAQKFFEDAYALNLKLWVARLNLGIALLNQQKLDAARAALEESVKRMPENPRGWYNLGLLHKSLGQAEQALEAFSRAVNLVPNDPDTHYFLGLLHTQLQKYDEGIAAFERALALNTFHASAEFGLARAHQRKGNADAARNHLNRFQKLVQEKLGVPMSLNYGDQGPYSLVEQVAPPAGPVPPAIAVRFVSVPAVESGLRLSGSPAAQPGSALGSGACFFDYNNDGRPDLLVLNNGREALSPLYRHEGGRFLDVTQQAKLEVRGPGFGCAAGDYDNDGWTDLAVSFEKRVAIYRNQGDGTFREATKETGIAAKSAAQQALTFVDYDHDGDLDIYIAADAALWRNNGNRTFTDRSELLPLPAEASGRSAVSTDFNNDRAIDLVITTAGQPPKLLVNPREGRFQAMALPGKSLPPAVGAAVLDFDKDGWMDVAFTTSGAPGLMVWRNVGGKQVEQVKLPELNWQQGYGVAALDYDNDGWIDLATVGEDSGGHLVLLRNEGPAGFRDVTRQVGFDRVKLLEPRSLITADYDSDGDTDLVITQGSGPPVLLRNDGGNKNNWLRLSLKAFADNKSAIGTKVEVFAGALYQKWEVQGASGYLGQSATEIIAGLGSAKEADIVRLLWPTGVPQDEVQLAARAAHNVTELDRRGSSCPVLFVWNGSRYEFVADMIGPGIVGHWVAPGERNAPDPTEYLKVSGASVRPRNGRLSFRFVEPMEEVVYLDQVRLLAVDHPADVTVYPNERFAATPPFPEFKIIASRGARPPVAAWDERGRDVLSELTTRDRRYVTGFGSSTFKGFAQTHWVELDLGEWNAARPLRLLLHGFTDYFTATSVYAAHQAGVTAIVPYVEALDATGRWVRVIEDMGFPAGLARTMLADLTGRVPAGTQRIRIVTNLKIYWDQILIDTSTEDGEQRITEVPLSEANLRFLGYPRERQGNPPADISYVYEEVSATGPFAWPVGAYTRYGEVPFLLRDVDDRFVVLGTGEEVALEFDPAGLPPLPPGWTRDYLFFADGFSKDMDFYAAYGDTVEPLPFHRMGRYPHARADDPGDESAVNYRLDYNTRFLSGRAAPAYRFNYRK